MMPLNSQIAKFILDHTVQGDHHKQWVLDQVLRMLVTEPAYKSMIQEYEDEDYEWDLGIPP